MGTGGLQVTESAVTGAYLYMVTYLVDIILESSLSRLADIMLKEKVQSSTHLLRNKSY